MTAKLSKLTHFLDRLDEADVHYTLSSIREGAILVGATVPGEHWEVEFMADGEVEVEVFRSSGDIEDESNLDALFEKAGEDGG